MSRCGAIDLNGMHVHVAAISLTYLQTSPSLGGQKPALKNHVIAHFLFPAFRRLCFRATLIPQGFLFFFLAGGTEAWPSHLIPVKKASASCASVTSSIFGFSLLSPLSEEDWCPDGALPCPWSTFSGRPWPFMLRKCARWDTECTFIFHFSLPVRCTMVDYVSFDVALHGFFWKTSLASWGLPLRYVSLSATCFPFRMIFYYPALYYRDIPHLWICF